MKLQDIRHLGKDDILDALGLMSRPTTASWLLGALGFFAIGALCGAGAALLLAPKSGRDLRQDLGQRINRVRAKAPGDGQTLEGI